MARHRRTPVRPGETWTAGETWAPDATRTPGDRAPSTDTPTSGDLAATGEIPAIDGGPRGRRRTIRGRLARILALPLIAVVVLLTVVVVDDTSAYRTATQTNRAVGLILQVGNLVHALQMERGLASGLLGGDVSFRAEMPDARDQVDTERSALLALVGGAGGAESAAVAAAVASLDDLDGIRTRIDANRATRTIAFAYFTDRIAALSNVDVGVDRSPDETLRREVAAIQALGEIKEYTSQERAFLNGVFAAGGFAAGEYQTFVTINAEQHAALTRYNRYASAAQRDLLAQALDTGAAREAAFFEERALAAVDLPFVVSPQSWWSAHTTLLDDMREAQNSLARDISTRAEDLQVTAALRLGVLAVLALLCASGAAALLVAAARAITRPLAALAAEARAVASVRLPEAVGRIQASTAVHAPDPPVRVAVPDRSSTEIVAVAKALDSAQATAYALATEQARLRRSTSESLANLGRRNQNLLRRQLGFISQLEREETDPSGLANLFELDHLATRMRRNAESLLVLVGESSPRTWSEALPVADVLRAAISEVEDYRRVTLRRIDDSYVSGAFVAGIAHMIAELVENGLAFSPPDVDVEIQGRILPGRYLIGITDQGLGMDAEEMARANARLRGEESFLTAPTRYLGHYVVGHLARQMGIDVQIAPSPVTGVTARVTLPASVLAIPPAIGGWPEPPAAGGRGVGPDGDSRSPLAITAPVVEYVTAGGRAVAPAMPVRATAGTARRASAGVPGPRVPVSAPPGAPYPANGGPPVPNGAAPSRGFTTPPHRVGPGPEAGYRTAGVPDDIAAQVAHGSGERTRNGLLKRIPRGRVPSAAPPEPPAGGEVGGPPGLIAAELRSRLTSLRAGVARGETDHAATDGAASRPEAVTAPGSEAERSTHAR